MNFQSMEYFAAVAKNRSFTRAADALHITQQTLSAHIAGIERELGCPLLIRHIPLELTYAGEVFLRYATEFNTKYDCMLHEFGDILNNQTGKLRIGIAFTRGHAIMPELIAAFQKEYPGVDVELVESSNDVLQKYLLDGTIDGSHRLHCPAAGHLRQTDREHYPGSQPPSPLLPSGSVSVSPKP